MSYSMDADMLEGHGDGRDSSEIGKASSLEDEFVIKASLQEGEGCENAEDTTEDDSDDVIFDYYEGSSSEEWVLGQGSFVQKFARRVIKDGKEVDLPANQWFIYLKEGGPTGIDEIIPYHLSLLERVVGSRDDAKFVYTNAYCATLFTAILTDEELAKLSGFEEVRRTSIAESIIEYH